MPDKEPEYHLLSQALSCRNMAEVVECSRVRLSLLQTARYYEERAGQVRAGEGQ